MKPSVTTTSAGPPSGHVAALDVADVVEATGGQCRREVVAGPPAQRVALAGLGSHGEQADAGVLEAEPGPGVGGAG